MAPAAFLPVEPGDRVLDLCAAPGGKSTALAAKLQGEGILLSNDISASRCKPLLKNMEMAGISNAVITCESPEKLADRFFGYFDKVLVDAPCSGEGMFRKEKKMVKAWEEHGPEFFSKLQRSIITQAAAMLKPGGMLLYSTCTFDSLENEQTIEYLLEQFPQFTICEMEGYEGFAPGRPEETKAKLAEIQKTVRIFPHKMQGEGHYLALLKKGESREDACTLPSRESKPLRKLPEELEAFFRDVAEYLDIRRLDIREERVYYMPEGLPELKGIRFLRSGLLLGELKKKRFEPSQALAMCLSKETYKNILNLSVEDERVIKYLKGETLDVEDLIGRKEKGWYLVCVDGYPLGFGKLANQTLKNKYLPGWRWQS